MVTSVNGSSLAALLAQENALANRTPSQPNAGPSASDAASQPQSAAVVYSGDSNAPALSGILSVQDSLNRAASISDVGLSAGQTITDLLAEMRGKVVAAQSAPSPDQRQSLDADYRQLLQAVDQMANSASFQGTTMLNGSGAGDLTFSADPNGGSSASLTALDLTAQGLGLSGTGLGGSSADLAQVLEQVDAASSAAATQVAGLGAQSDQIQGHLAVLGQLQSSLAGAAASPDLSADTARLQALQVQQALSQQSAAVVNQAPSALLSLFRAD